MANFSSTYPSTRPVFNADFSNAGRLDPRISYTRSTTGTFFGTDKHLSSENLIPNSNTNAAWQTFDVTTSVSGSFLDGSDSLLVSETANTAIHYISPNVGAGNSTSFVSGTEYTAVMYAKSGTDNIIQVGMTSGAFGANAYANYDLSNAATPPVTGSAATATITALGSDWVQLTLTATATSSATGTGMFVAFTNNDINAGRAPGYAGDTAANVYLWEGNVSSTGQKYLVETNGQIHREYAPTLQTAAINAPRFEHSATDSASMGLLIEGQSTNLFLRSESIGSSAWTKFRSERDGDVAVAPDGTLTADKLREDTSTNTHGIYQQFTVSSATACTVSVFAKAAGRNHLSFLFDTTNGVFGGDFVWFNLSTGVVGTTDSDITASIESCGNGWYRCVATRTALASGSGRAVFYLADADNSNSYTGDKYSGVLLWGAMAEESSHCSSYLKTEASTATRAADSASAVTADIGYTGGPVTVVGEFSLNTDAISSSATVVQLTSTGGNDRAYIYQDQSNERLYGVIQSDGGYPASKDLLGAAAVSGTNYKFAFSADTNDYKAVVNNGTVHTDTDMQLPNEFDKLAIGYNFHGGAGQINGHYKRLAIYSNGMTATNVSALTS